jgi:rhodanese-related sulfurtransferase
VAALGTVPAQEALIEEMTVLPRSLLTQVALMALLAPALAGAQVNGAAELPAVPKSKQTALGLYVTAREAYEKWKASPQDVMVIDVRTLEEFIFVGHPTMAWLIPFATQTNEWDAGKRMYAMKPVPDFVERVLKVAKPSSTLLVTCRSGGRGALAVNALAKAGFTNVYNITDGVEGDEVKDPESVFVGQRLVNGWKNSGAPWTYEIDPARVLLPK